MNDNRVKLNYSKYIYYKFMLIVNEGLWYFVYIGFYSSNNNYFYF